MSIDVDLALSAPPRRRSVTWSRRDVVLYHLGIGVGTTRELAEGQDLDWVLMEGSSVIPTFALVLPHITADGPLFDPPGCDVPLSSLLHLGQTLYVPTPLSSRDSCTLESRVTGIYDKGNAAVIEEETLGLTSGGDLLFRSSSSFYARGEGGFGGPRGNRRNTEPAPLRDAEAVVQFDTAPTQAMIYQLSGDANPLHTDPRAARQMGFERPILHGLSTMGATVRSVIASLADYDVGAFTKFDGSFVGAVFPGEKLTASSWSTRTGLRLAVDALSADADPRVKGRHVLELAVDR